MHTADDAFLRPIAGVQVYIIGLESRVVLNDRFERLPLVDRNKKTVGPPAGSPSGPPVPAPGRPPAPPSF